jgi:TonB family protein
MRAHVRAAFGLALSLCVPTMAAAVSPTKPIKPGPASAAPASPSGKGVSPDKAEMIPGGIPQAAFRTPLDVYPALVAARVSGKLPPIGPEMLGGRKPTELSVRVRVQLDAAGAVTSAEILRASGVGAFDALVIETLSDFRGAQPGSKGALPLPKDAARLQAVTTQGLTLDVRPPTEPKGAGSAPASKEPR